MSWQNEATAELDRIDGHQTYKKRETIIAIVDARLAGRSEESVWRLPNTCSRNTYHAKWKKDVIFSGVLETITKLARGWKDGEAMRALEEAARRMALASPVAVTRAIEKLSSGDEAIVLRAAFGILDRAGMETATKQQVAGDLNLKGYTTASPDDWDDDEAAVTAESGDATEAD